MGELISSFLDSEISADIWKLYGYEILEEWEMLGGDWADALL